MEFPMRELVPAEFPKGLLEIPQVPETLYVRGELPPQEHTLLAVVGSRDYTSYGKAVVEHLIGGLRGYPIGVVSGLALGIDALAHEAALGAGLYTLSVPGSGLDDKVLYPRKNRGLAHRILEAGGGLLSEFEPLQEAAPWTFPQRNRIMAGLAQATLIIEAKEQSGTLITARLTAEYNRELLVVPGDIFRENSKGPHQFLKLGATPVTEPADILDALGIEGEPAATKQPRADNPKFQAVLHALSEPTERDALIRVLDLTTAEANIILMQMEIEGLITNDNDVIRRR